MARPAAGWVLGHATFHTEIPVKKKGPRSIPDFSRKRTGRAPTELPQPKGSHPSAPRDRVVKPRATSAKSGRRGQ